MIARPPRALVPAVLAASAFVHAPLAAARPRDAQSPPAATNPASSPADANAAYFADFAGLQMRLQRLDDAHAACALSSLAQTGEGRDGR